MKRQAILIAVLMATHSLALTPTIQMQKLEVKVEPRGSEPYCQICLSFAGQFLNLILNSILRIGVVGSCGELCSIVTNRFANGSQVVGTVCNILCDIVGVREFMKIVEEADLDPIYYCELLNVCKYNDYGDATIQSLVITPNAIPQDSQFTIEATYSTNNGTSTGEINLFIATVDGIPLGDSELMLEQEPGTYNLKWTGVAGLDPDCDPTQGFCEMWLPGNYTAEVAICAGQCGSNHPHSSIYDKKNAGFTVTR